LKRWFKKSVETEFQAPKCGKFAQTKLGTCGKLVHTKLGTLETWISRLGKITFSGLKYGENFHTLCDGIFR